MENRKVNLIYILSGYMAENLDSIIQENYGTLEEENKDELLSVKGKIIDINSERYQKLFELTSGNLEMIKKLY